MLVIQRKESERFMIFPESGGDVITVTVVQLGNGRVRLGIEAVPAVRVYREELLAREGIPPARSAVPVAPVQARQT